MKYELLYDEFKKEIPECEDFCVAKEKENAVHPTDDGMHIIFGMVVVPYILHEVVERRDTEKINKIFEFLEKMAKSQNTSIQEVLEFSIIEAFIAEGREKLQLLKKYMHDETLECCKHQEQYFVIGSQYDLMHNWNPLDPLLL